MKTNLSDSLFSLTAKMNYHYYNVRKWYQSVNWLKLIVWAVIGLVSFCLFLKVSYLLLSLIP